MSSHTTCDQTFEERLVIVKVEISKFRPMIPIRIVFQQYKSSSSLPFLGECGLLPQLSTTTLLDCLEHSAWIPIEAVWYRQLELIQASFDHISEVYKILQ
jgi:hypothetical protein